MRMNKKGMRDEDLRDEKNKGRIVKKESLSQSEKIERMKGRAKDYALQAIHLYTKLPKRTEAQVLGKQLLRSATSVGAHYREACRAKSRADFINKLEGGLQELEESAYWLELLSESKLITEKLSRRYALKPKS